MYFRHYLLAVARAYAAAEGLALATVARRFHGNDSFFDQFESGSITITLRKYDEMIARFYQQWPRAAIWPDGGTVKLKKSSAKRRG